MYVDDLKVGHPLLKGLGHWVLVSSMVSRDKFLWTQKGDWTMINPAPEGRELSSSHSLYALSLTEPTPGVGSSRSLLSSHACQTVVN